MDNKRLGYAGEKLAQVLLEIKGYSILETNFSCRCGEVDIIAKKECNYVFCEVKTRTSDKYGEGRNAVNKEKQKHIRNCARVYLEQSKAAYDSIEYQVIEISIEHLKGLVF